MIINRTHLFALFFLSFMLNWPLHGMEPIPYFPGLHAHLVGRDRSVNQDLAQSGENESLLEAMPPALSMSDDESECQPQNILFDGTRRYYDRASKRAVCIQSTKRALGECGLCILGSGIIGACLGATVGGFFGASNLLFYSAGGTVACSGMGCLSCTMTLPHSCVRDIANDPEEVDWKDSLAINPTLRTSPDSTKLVWIPHVQLETLLAHAADKGARGRDDCLMPWIGKVLTCYYKKEKLLFNELRNRLAQKPRVALEHLLICKRLGLPAILTKRILTQAELTAHSITQNELLILLEDLRDYGEPIQIADDYARLMLLAHNGWISFTQSEKYPTRCEMRYFDADALPAASKKWYGLRHGPTVYMPASSDHIQYYKFDEDPFYQNEGSAQPHNNNI